MAGVDHAADASRGGDSWRLQRKGAQDPFAFPPLPRRNPRESAAIRTDRGCKAAADQQKETPRRASTGFHGRDPDAVPPGMHVLAKMKRIRIIEVQLWPGSPLLWWMVDDMSSMRNVSQWRCVCENPLSPPIPQRLPLFIFSTSRQFPGHGVFHSGRPGEGTRCGGGCAGQNMPSLGEFSLERLVMANVVSCCCHAGTVVRFSQLAWASGVWWLGPRPGKLCSLPAHHVRMCNAFLGGEQPMMNR
jgi:hypothetical protein